MEKFNPYREVGTKKPFADIACEWQMTREEMNRITKELWGA